MKFFKLAHLHEKKYFLPLGSLSRTNRSVATSESTRFRQWVTLGHPKHNNKVFARNILFGSTYPAVS